MKKKEVETKTKWSIDHDHSIIEFKVRHLMMMHVRGEFKTFDASIYTNDKDFKTSEIDLWIDVASISTGNEKRDDHLKSQDFFDIAQHKQITFRASTISAADADGVCEIWGELTILGITRNVKLDIQFGSIIYDLSGNLKTGFSISGMINRNEWGLNWNASLDNGGFMVGEDVVITCDIELICVSQNNLIMELEPTTDRLSSK